MNTTSYPSRSHFPSLLQWIYYQVFKTEGINNIVLGVIHDTFTFYRKTQEWETIRATFMDLKYEIDTKTPENEKHTVLDHSGKAHAISLRTSQKQ